MPQEPALDEHEALLAWWTPLVHLTRFAMGLRRPGLGLHQLLNGTSEEIRVLPGFADLVTSWWGGRLEDFIAWGVLGGDEHIESAAGWGVDPGIGPLLPDLTYDERRHYERLADRPEWRAVWAGGGDPLHLSDHSCRPLTPDPGMSWSIRSDAVPELTAPSYAGWFRALVERSDEIARPEKVLVQIRGFGPLGYYLLRPGKWPVLSGWPAAALPGFSPYVQEQLGWYVYLLRHPVTGEVFYVGKGKGNRAFQHARDAVELIEAEKPKLTLIREIIDGGHEVHVDILRHRLPSESAAYEVEATALDLFKEFGHDLTNIAGGHHSGQRGLATSDNVVSLYEASAAREINEPMILFRLPVLWYPSMSVQELYDATRGWWRLATHVGPRARYAAAVSKGVIRAVYVIESWRERVPGDRDWEEDIGKQPRLGFKGHPATDVDDLLNKSVRHLFKPGQQGLVYLNCGDPALPPRAILRGPKAVMAQAADQ